jgi:hypothetical protein
VNEAESASYDTSTDDDTKVLGIHNTSTHLSHYNYGLSYSYIMNNTRPPYRVGLLDMYH